MTTQEIKQELLKISQLRTNQYTDRENKLLIEIIHSGDSAMKGEAAYAVYTSMSPYIRKAIKKAGITQTSQNYDDLQQEMFLAILERMDKWNPEEGSFITYIVPELKHILFVQSEAVLSKTGYAHAIEHNIKKALSELSKFGNDDPTPSEVKAQMKLMGVNVSTLQTQTVSEHMQRMSCSDTVPFDENLKLASRFPTPEESMIQEEHNREIWDAVASLGSPYREIIEALYECMEDDPGRNSLPTYQTIRDKYNSINAYNPDLPVMDTETVKRAFDVAVKQFTGKYNFHYNRDELNINSHLRVEDIDNDINDITAAAEQNLTELLKDEEDDIEIVYGSHSL